MTEPLFLCEMIWVAVWLVEWRTAADNDPPRASAACFDVIALALVAAVFTRYDGWVLALLAGRALVLCSCGRARCDRGRSGSRAQWWSRRH